jgi:hypothetical protein
MASQLLGVMHVTSHHDEREVGMDTCKWCGQLLSSFIAIGLKRRMLQTTHIWKEGISDICSVMY